jgi:putative ABC transport system permease protein
MNELFGIPTGALAAAVTVALAAGLVVVAALALRNPIFLKLGLRNIPRRRGRTALIVTGLMLGTAIVATALATGDTMSTTIRSYVVHSLGDTDEIVSVQGVDVDPIALGAADVEPFAEWKFERIRNAVAASPDVDGVAPAIFELVAVRDATSRQNEPRVTLFASDGKALAGFAPIRAGGEEVSLDDLLPGEIYLNEIAAEDLHAAAGDQLLVTSRNQTTPFFVREVVEFDGAGTAEGAILAPLVVAQSLVHLGGQVEHVLVSNRGDSVAGAELTDEVTALLQPELVPLGLESAPEKRDGLELADEQGAGMMSMFTTFGSFSIVAGIMLVFLIFVMLAAERRGELGIARALGTRRSHLVQTYLFEGVAYDLAAAAVGTLLGIAVAFGMVAVMAQVVEALGVELTFGVTWRSAVLAYSLGVLLTLIVVTVSAWRVSVLNIATAVRNLPEPPKRRRRRRHVLPLLGVLAGGLLTASGLSAADFVAFGLGVSLVLVSAAPIARNLGVRERAAYTGAGLAIVVFWLLPSTVFDTITEFSTGFGVFLIGGLMLVVGATWVIMYNADLLLAGLAATVGRIRAVAPVLKLSIAYPLRSLFRTGVTLAMFTLVVFTLVVGTTISGSFMAAFDDLETFGGGFEVRAVASPANPIPDAATAVPRAAPSVRATGGQSVVPAEARQEGTGGAFADYPVNGFDDAFLATTSYGFAAVADGYTADGVWDALRSEPGLAVVDPFVAPRRDNYQFGVPPDFQLTGFYLEDGRFAPIPVQIKDPQTGKAVQLTVIGVLSDAAPQELLTGISTSQSTLERALGGRATPTAYWFDLRPGADAAAAAAQIESAFLANGVEAEALQETLDDTVAYSKTFNAIVAGFMGLGLVVGVAALGVISARAVVERRQQIGVLRSIGFQRRMIQAAFLLESSFVALTAIVVGTTLGLVIAYEILLDSAKQPSWESLEFTVPWVGLGVIFAVVYAVALLTTLAPALRASRVYPAEALRYQ